MHRSSCRGDHFTYPFVLKSVADLEFIITGRCIHGLSRKDGLDSDMYVATALIDMYAKCGDLVDARKVFDEIPVRDVSSWNAMISGYMREGSCAHARVLFDEMPVRNIVSWTSMISGYTQSGHSDAALQLFDLMTMEDSTVKPNWVTVMSILPACENSSDLERGRRIHSFAREKGLDTHSSVQTALIAMYAKCGSLLDARSCFDGMNSTSRNSSSTWNAMITAYSSHGLGKEAVETFEAMIKSGSAAPDSITFTGLLSGCGHSGLVEQGLKYFEEMSSTHGVEKTREHYACVVDMLGRAGRVAEAYEVSDGMPMAAGASVWGSLLAASSRWNENVEAAEVAAEKLLELEPDNSGTYAMLSNMYAEAQMWEEVDGLRLFQRSRRVKKNPGSSWID
ncbi:hypothetical protein M569_01496 [Genlisea aurea]|uniref:Pentatricopeptide repeat-containing protein n=1 Tax=Genlisea aurea TaxID=192259 RepID=S8EKW5_9LAMI|nr:hypothetical protein M569_01496 [Genlisea aurea]